MVQTTKAYKVSWKQTLKAYKSNMGTNQQRHQTHVQNNSQITNPVQTHDEAPLSITPQCNSLAGTLKPLSQHLQQSQLEPLRTCHYVIIPHDLSY